MYDIGFSFLLRASGESEHACEEKKVAGERKNLLPLNVFRDRVCEYLCVFDVAGNNLAPVLYSFSVIIIT